MAEVIRCFSSTLTQLTFCGRRSLGESIIKINMGGRPVWGKTGNPINGQLSLTKEITYEIYCPISECGIRSIRCNILYRFMQGWVFLIFSLFLNLQSTSVPGVSFYNFNKVLVSISIPMSLLQFFLLEQKSQGVSSGLLRP